MPHTLLKRLLMSLGCLSGGVFAPAGQAATPIGNPVRVNTDTAGNQTPLFFSAGSNGEKVLVWADAAPNKYQHEGIDYQVIYFQKIKPSGDPVLYKQHQLDPFPENYTSLSIGHNGHSVLADRRGLFRHVTDEMTIGIGDDFLKARNTVASLDADVGVSLAFTRPKDDSFPRTLFIRRFDVSDFYRLPTPISPEVTVASDVPGGSEQLTGELSIAADKAQNIGLVWKVRTSSSPEMTELRTQRFDRQGVALTPVHLVSSGSPNYQTRGSISMEPGGKSLIVWSASADSGQTWNVYARCYDANGTPLTGPIQINQSFLLGEPEPTAAMTADSGNFVVAWKASNGVFGGTPTPALAAREFRGDGTPIGNEFRVDPPQDQPADHPRLAMDLSGNFAVAWRSNSAQTGGDVMVRTYKMDTRPPVVELVKDRPAQGLAGDADSWTYYKLTVPYWVGQLNFDMTGPVGVGDGDMYVRFGALPSATAWDWRPYVNGSNESVGISNPVRGEYYIAIHGRSAYSSVGLKASYSYRP